jgi:hypothetical protein
MIDSLNNIFREYQINNEGNPPTHLLMHPKDYYLLFKIMYEQGLITIGGGEVKTYLSAKIIRSYDVDVDKYYFL